MDSALVLMVASSLLAVSWGGAAWLIRRAEHRAARALAMVTTALDQRDAAQHELRRAAVATVALVDLVAAQHASDDPARAAEALVAWLGDPRDAAARATLERAGLPAAWLDGAAGLLISPGEG